MADESEKIRKALSSLHKAANEFLTGARDAQSVKDRRRYLRREIGSLRDSLKETRVASLNDGTCDPPCIDGWDCVQGDCYPPALLTSSVVSRKSRTPAAKKKTA